MLNPPVYYYIHDILLLFEQNVKINCIQSRVELLYAH